MDLLIIVAAVLVIIGFLVVIGFKDKQIADERSTHREELQNLLNRIQAPERVPVEPMDNEPSRTRMYVPMDDDAAYWEYQRTKNGNNN